MMGSMSILLYGRTDRRDEQIISLFTSLKGVGGGLGVKILFDLVATYFKNLGNREVGAFYSIEKALPVAKF